MLPAAKLPARSMSRASHVKTEGVYPLAVGGSPAARPISRWAMANRVSESTTSKTFLPCALKYSATVVAASAARMRNSGDWSEVETTTVERASPSAPIASSRNSRTSRPRSPTRASTVKSAAVARVIMPISVLFPTPLPPSAGQQSVDGADAAPQRLANRRAFQRQRRLAVQQPVFACAIVRPPVDRLPRTVDHAAQQIGTHPERRLRPPRHDAVAIPNPARPLQRHRQYGLSAKAHDFSRKRLSSLG